MQFNRFFPKLILNAFLICLSSIAASAQTAPTNPEPSRRATATFRGESFQYKLSDADFANTPSWNENESEPPLSAKEAVRIARETAPRFVKGVETWKIRRVELFNMTGDKWFYRIHFTCLGAQCRDLSDRSFVSIVKMDGTIVEPKKIIVEN
jgi:hypothetical protein